MTKDPAQVERIAEPEWCEKCFGPVIVMPLWERALSRVCWWLAMHWPDRFFATKPHLAILPWAGNIAYRCHCRKGQSQ